MKKFHPYLASFIVLAAACIPNAAFGAETSNTSEDYVIVTGGAKDGAVTYTDRDHVYQKIPSMLQGADYVQTKIEDRFVAEPSRPLLELTLSKPATVYVGVDSRGRAPLSWLESWETIGETALAANHLKLELHAKTFPAGKVVLNGAQVSGAQVMYVIFASEGSIESIRRLDPQVSNFYDRPSDPHNFTVFMEQGGWCWFQEPRALVHNGTLFVGGVQGNDSGAARLGVYDLKADRALGVVTLQDDFDRDDHNAPALHLRPDGSVLAVYAKHHKEPTFYARISDPANPLKWSAEGTFEMSARVTYANLYEMKQERKLYNFFRGIRFNPTFVTSTDGGLTWTNETHFISSEARGTHRPYPRYMGNGVDTVYVSFTDGHPRQIGNSLYYAEFRDGKFWRADGTLIKDLAKDGPLRPSEAEVIYQGSGDVRQVAYSSEDTSVPNSAWTSSMAVDAQGNPHVAYSVHMANDDHRFRIASWDGEQWHDREVALGGSALYGSESSYTGLITFDPEDPSYVVLSSDVNPENGRKHSTHEIYRAQIGLTDAREDPNSWRPGIYWEEVTRNSPAGVRNIRPVVLRHGDRRIVLWNRGAYASYTRYEMDTVGLVESIDASIAVENPFATDSLLKIMKRVKTFQERGGRLPFNWLTGTFYSGVAACYTATGEEAFLNAARTWSASGNWQAAQRSPLNADAVCTAQTFLDVYFEDRDPRQIEQINEVFQTHYFGQDTIKKNLIGHSIWKESERPFTGRNLWWWCDALYMAPPVMARLGAATGDARYFELLHTLFWDATDYLYDPEEKLFFRDKRYFDRKTGGGKPVFWGRGNGWVIGGLVRTIDYIPEDDPMRAKYIKLFQDMMERIVSLQGEDGLWRASLNDPDWFPMPESSGSSFFTYGLAAGIERGWLDRERYMPALARAWRGLVSIVTPEGKVQWSQQVAADPYATKQAHSRSYTQGAFLLAASEVYKLAK